MPTLFQLPKAVPISAGSGFSGAKAYFYKPGTTTPITTYTTAALTVPHAHPVVADANGIFAPIFIDETNNTTYRLQLKTSSDVLIYDVDNIPALAAAANDWRYRITTAETAAGLTVADLTFGYDPGDLRRYGGDPTGATSCATALTNASSQATQSGGAAIKVHNGAYKLSTNTTIAATTATEFSAGKFSIDGGVTLTINGAVSAARTQIFSGAGAVVFGAGVQSPSTVYPEWWGALPDNSTESGPAIQAMFTAAKAGSIWEFSGGTYKNNATQLNVTKPGRIAGTGKGGITTGGTRLLWTGGAGTLLTLAANARPFVIEHLTLDNSGTGSIALQISNTTAQTIIRDVEVYGTARWATAGISTLTSENITHLTFERVDLRSSSALISLAPIYMRLARGQDFQLKDCYLSGALSAPTFATDIALELGDGTEYATGVTVIGGKIEHTGIGIKARTIAAATIMGVSFNGEDGGGSVAKSIEFGTVRGCRVQGNYFDGGGTQEIAYSFTSNNVSGLTIAENNYQSIGQSGDTLGVYEFVGGVQPDFCVGIEYYSGVTAQALIYPLTANSATPNVGPGNIFDTANTVATTITDLEPTASTPATRGGKTVRIRVQDANTTFDFTGTNLKGNDGVDYVASNGDMIIAHNVPRTTLWYCDIVKA